MKFRLVEDFDDLLLEAGKPDIEPGSELEKSLIYDIEHTDISYGELAKKYGLNSRSPIYSLIKRLDLNAIPRLRNKPLLIKPGSELENRLIYDIEHTDKSYRQLSKEYSVSLPVITDFVHRKNLRAEERRHFHDKRDQKMHVYFNTLQADIHAINIRRVEADLKFFPSIYIGEYSVGSIESMYEYVRKKYFETKPRCDTIIEFYLKIASNEISLNMLIEEMKAQSIPSAVIHTSTFDYKFITASAEKLSMVDFYSANYSQLAKDVLTFFSRKGHSSNDFDTIYKDLKAAAAKVDPKISDQINQIDTYISNNLERIAHNIYSKKGDIIESTNYINGIPYETSFNISSHLDLASCIRKYKGYLLYGLMNMTGDIVYVGISVSAYGRGDFYESENRPLILKAFEDDVIKKLIIFKSNLPIQSKSVNTQLIYALEAYFAEHLFKTYPENYPKALNKDKPGKNSSGFIASQKRMDLDTYISEQDKLLSPEEYRAAVKDLVGTSVQHHPYYEYAKKYIAEHNADLSFEDKKNLYMGLSGANRELLWDYCSSESEYTRLIPKSYMPSKRQERVNDWKNYRIENNLPITEDLDDDIDMEYYV